MYNKSCDFLSSNDSTNKITKNVNEKLSVQL